MNHKNIESVSKFVAEWLDIPISKIDASTELSKDLGIEGDDAVELLEGFSKRFNVGLDDFKHQDYFCPEGFEAIGCFFSLFIKSKELKVLNMKDLAHAIEVGYLV